MIRPTIAVAAGLAVLAATVLGGQLVSPPATTGTGVVQRVPVVGALAVCPDVRQVKNVLATRVSVGSAPRTDGVATPTSARVDEGHVVSQPLSGTGLSGTGEPTVVPLDGPGSVVPGLNNTVQSDGLVVTAAGALAAGLEVEQVARGESGPQRGFAGVRCEAPRAESWFVGGATTVGRDTTVYLANPDDSPAIVNLSVLTGSGTVDERPGRGLVVAPHSRLRYSLDRIAPDRTALAVRVLAERGRVAAAVKFISVDGTVGAGADWVPPALPPASHVVVPGLPASDGGRRFLQVSNWSEDDTTVAVRVTTRAAQFVPAGMAAVLVKARSSTTVEVGKAMGNDPATVEVTTDGGLVVAGGLAVDVQDGSAVTEVSFAGSAVPLAGPAVLTDLVIDRPTESVLILSALAADAIVEVRPIPVRGFEGSTLPAKRVPVAGGRSYVLPLSTFLRPGATGRLAIEVRAVAGSGPVYATRYLRARGARGPLTTLLGLQGAEQEVPLMRVNRDPLAGTGRRR